MSRYRDSALNAWIGGLALLCVILVVLWLAAIFFVGW